jgi:hypothetical protein
MHRFTRIALVLLSLASAATARADEPAAGKEANVTPLFDGKSLTGWKIGNFAGTGEVTVENGQIIVSKGEALSGVTWKDAATLPKDEYEITLQAMKLKGDDFFCGVTFPVRESHASFICGGWAGTVVGLSSIDSLDASENETTSYKKFEPNKWYKIRIRVAGNKIECWIDDEQMVDVDLTDKRISTRIESDASRPLGISTYQVTSAFKDIELKKLKAK